MTQISQPAITVNIQRSSGQGRANSNVQGNNTVLPIPPEPPEPVLYDLLSFQGGGDKIANLYNPDLTLNGELIFAESTSGALPTYYGVSVSRDNSLVAFSSEAVTYFPVLEYNSWTPIDNPAEMPAAGSSRLTFSPTADILVLMREDGDVWIYNTITWERIYNGEGILTSPRVFANCDQPCFSPDGNLLFYCADSGVRYLDITNPLTPTDNAITSGTIPDGLYSSENYLIAARDDLIQIWSHSDYSAPQNEIQWNGGAGEYMTPYTVTISPNEAYFAVGCSSPTNLTEWLLVYDLSTLNKIAYEGFPVGNGPIQGGIAFSADNSVMFISFTSGQIMAYDTETWDILHDNTTDIDSDPYRSLTVLPKYTTDFPVAVWADRTDNLWFTAFGSPDNNNYSYSSGRWQTTVGESGQSDLLAVGGPFGENDGWADNFAPTKMRITVNSGPDFDGLGSLTGTVITLLDNTNSVVATEAIDFDSYNQAITREVDITIPPGNNFVTFRVNTNLTGIGVLIYNIEFLVAELN